MKGEYEQVIAIDGPAASGKSTLARALADRIGYLFFDTGVMYRAVTAVALSRGLDLSNEPLVNRMTASLTLDLLPSDGHEPPYRVLADGQDITTALRARQVESNVSLISSYGEVRRLMTERQREIARRGRVVMVGRDIGTVVVPDAGLKLWLDASPEARAERRHLESQGDQAAASYEEMLRDIKRRDAIDSGRAIAPMKPAPDAHRIDTTALSELQVLEAVLELIRRLNEENIA